MSFNYILLFSFTVFIASIIPGPSMLLALTHGVQFGIRKTLISAMGNVAVTLVQSTISIVGLGAILMTSRPLFVTIKWVGVIYLFYMGIKLILSKNQNFNVEQNEENLKTSSSKKLFIQSMLVTAANPKAILFFTAIFPQFVDIESTLLIHSLLLLGIVCLIAFICFMIYAIGGEKLFSLLARTGIAKYVGKIFGVSFIGAGIGLASN